MEFEIVGRAQDIVDGLAGHVHHQPRAFDEAWSEDLVREISERFRARADRKTLRHRAEAEPRDLRKDEPHPVAPLAAGREFGADIGVDAVLRVDEALIVEAKVPQKCQYSSMILTNDLYETTDWYNNHSSLNDSQYHVDKDGLLRAIVSAKDPGVANWLDTAGYPTGLIQGRWTNCDAQPIPSVRKVALSEVRKSLPRDTQLMTAAEREHLIRERRSEFQQRPLW